MKLIYILKNLMEEDRIIAELETLSSSPESSDLSLDDSVMWWTFRNPEPWLVLNETSWIQNQVYIYKISRTGLKSSVPDWIILFTIQAYINDNDSFPEDDDYAISIIIE